MMGVLVVVAGPAAGRRVDLTGQVTVGRREGEVLLEDQEISRRHCLIAPGPAAEVVVTDLNSTNGTWINGARIAGPTILRPGDELRIGDSVCRIEVPQTAPWQAPAQPHPGQAPPAQAAPVQPSPAPAQPPPAPAQPAAASAAPPPPAPVGAAAPAQPFGAFAPAPGVGAAVRPRRGVATRLPIGVAFAWAVIGADAIALIVYFTAR
jgi:predicted component of type VI protein secretion system